MARRPPAAPPPTAAEAAPPHGACWRTAAAGTCVLTLHVQPNARQTEVLGVHEGALRLKLAAPPVDGQANEALVAWLAKELGCAKRALRLKRGAAARHKQVEIDLDGAQLAAWLARRLPAP